MSAVCPACGVGVVPGMVRCPKCGAGLPRSKRAATHVEGGTALPTAAGFPMVPVGGAAVVAIIAFLALRGGPSKPVATDEVDAGTEDTEVAPPPVATIETPTAPTQPGATAVDPGPAIRAIEAGLRREKLWGTVTIEGDRVDVRSGGCADAAMPAVLDGAAAGLHDAGLTTLRCLEQGGRVVFERGL